MAKCNLRIIFNVKPLRRAVVRIRTPDDAEKRLPLSFPTDDDGPAAARYGYPDPDGPVQSATNEGHGQLRAP